MMKGFLKWLFGDDDRTTSKDEDKTEDKNEYESRILASLNGLEAKGEKVWFVKNVKFYCGAREFTIKDIVITDEKVFVVGERHLNLDSIETCAITLMLPKKQA